jgi:hypothetical protein
MRRRRGAASDTIVRNGSGARQGKSAVVVSELNEDEVAGLHIGEGCVPMSVGDVCVAAESADRAVHYIDLRQVEELREWRAPTPQAVRMMLGSFGLTGPVSPRRCSKTIGSTGSVGAGACCAANATRVEIPITAATIN